MNRHSQHNPREGACGKAPERADHDLAAPSRPALKPGVVECGCRLRQSRVGALNRSRTWRGGCGQPSLGHTRSARGGCPCPVQRSAGAAMTEHAVVIAGAGPTGLMTAGELALAGVDVVIVERRASQDLDGSRAGGLLSRTIEVLDQRGIAERFLSAGQVMQGQGFAQIPLDLGRIESGWSMPGTMAWWSSRSWRDRCAPGRGDPTRRACRLGRRPRGPRAASSTCDLVRSIHSGLEPTALPDRPPGQGAGLDAPG